MNTNRRIKAVGVLVLVTAIWGLTFPLIQMAIGRISPETFVFLRFVIATAVLLPILYPLLRQTNRNFLIHGFWLGLFTACTNLFQTIGLRTITADRSAFITASYVVLVPFLAPLFKLSRPKPMHFIASFLCLLGIYILTGHALGAIKSGDIWTLLCALTTALQIVYLQKVTLKLKNYGLLNFYQILLATPMLLLPAYVSNSTGMADILQGHILLPLLFCGAIATGTSLYLQTRYQHFVGANQAALIYCLEPVFASIFSWLILGEQFTPMMFVGAGLVLIATLIPR